MGYIFVDVIGPKSCWIW